MVAYIGLDLKRKILDYGKLFLKCDRNKRINVIFAFGRESKVVLQDISVDLPKHLLDLEKWLFVVEGGIEGTLNATLAFRKR